MANGAAGRLIVVSGPSGAGKSTLLKRVLASTTRPLVSSISATTRPPRPGEVDGRDYYFLTSEEFARRRDAGEFLECFEVYGRGHWYGTLRSEVTTGLAAGKWVVLEIDVQGTEAIRRQFPAAVTIFVRPKSFAELEKRLRDRATESEAALARRLEVGRRELAAADTYDYQVINEDLDRAVADLCQILNQLGAEST
ncbi:MAG: guanylate kinase [Pirellulales bacterium]|nr:guanylate kinase [Pirellulales bacterium]